MQWLFEIGSAFLTSLGAWHIINRILYFWAPDCECEMEDDEAWD